MTTSVTVRHNFEAAHRLYALGGKCRNLHGHSWWAEITVEAEPVAGIVVDFGRLKSIVREWIDQNLDHGTMIGHEDPLLPALREDGTKLFVFGGLDANPPAWSMAWPTVENVARLLYLVIGDMLGAHGLGERVRVTRVRVSETHVNAAEVTA